MNFTNIILKYSSTYKALYFEWYGERARVKYNKKSNCKAFWVYANAHQSHSCTFLTPLVLVTWLFQEAESQSFVSRYAMLTVYRKSFKPLSIPQELLKNYLNSGSLSSSFMYLVMSNIFAVSTNNSISSNICQYGRKALIKRYYFWVTVRPIDA